RTGADPSAERHATRGAITVSELCDIYLADTKGRIKPSTLAMDRSRIECHVKPLIGRCTVAALTQRDVERFQADVAAGKTARPSRQKGRGGNASGGRGVAARTVGMLGTILEFGKRHGMIADNPARGVRRFPDNKRRRFLSLDELAALGEAMREATARGESCTGVAAIRTLLLTGCRRSEVLALPWGWLDTKARCIRFEDTKSGPQLRPIGLTAVKQIAALSHKKSCQWVFPAEPWRRTFHRLATGSRTRMRTRRPKGCNGTHTSTLLCGNRSRAWLLGANHRRLARAHGAGRDGALCPCSRFRANCCSGSRLRADCGGPRWFRRGSTGYSIEKEAHAALRRDHTRIRPS